MLSICGDSHLLPIEYAYKAGWFGPVRCRFRRVGGATAVGLRHPTSKTEALTIFRRALLPARPGVVPVFQLGEVDCGFVIWHRAAKYGESVEAQLDASVAAYITFVDELRAAGYPTVILTAATVPTIVDGALDRPESAGEVALLRASVTASLAERTALTARYNERLRSAAAARGLPFVDLTPDLIDPSTGVVADRFRHVRAEDHHLHPVEGGRLWARRLTEALASLSR
nr:SGNH/GDSL hydrolase family protein [Chthonobacter rhizosphaerae]